MIVERLSIFPLPAFFSLHLHPEEEYADDY